MTIEIMLPFYGRRDYLSEAVTSILGQDDADWTLTVIDDAYPDPAAAGWVADIDDHRVRYLRNDHNLGVSATFQRCLELASHEWLVIMGGDDRMLPSFVSRMQEDIARFPDVDYVQPGVRVIDDQGAPQRPLVDRVKSHYRVKVERPTVLGGRALVESLLQGNWTYFPATCWRRSAILAYGFEPRYQIVPDWWLQLRLLEEGATMLLDPHVTFEYRRHGEQASTAAAVNVSRFHEEKDLMLHARRLMEGRGWTRAARRANWHVSSRGHALVTLAARLRRGRVSGSGMLLRHVLTNRPPPGTWPSSVSQPGPGPARGGQ